MAALFLLGLYLGEIREALSLEEARHHAQQLAELPVKLEHLLNESEKRVKVFQFSRKATPSSVGSDHVIEIPTASDLLTPILSIIPLQVLAYHIAVRRGRDVDQPRNLAKSVTVE